LNREEVYNNYYRGEARGLKIFILSRRRIREKRYLRLLRKRASRKTQKKSSYQGNEKGIGVLLSPRNLKKTRGKPLPYRS